MSSASSKSRASASLKSVTHKPWFLTCCNGEVFAWKNGARLKLRSGQSAGCVNSVAVLSARERTISVSECFANFGPIYMRHALLQLHGTTADGSGQYMLSCCLDNFQCSANEFSSNLASAVGDPYKFVAELNKATDVTAGFIVSARKRERASGKFCYY